MKFVRWMVVMVLVLLLAGCDTAPQLPTEPTTSPTQMTDPTEPPTEESTEPFVVDWMTFEEDRELTAAQYFVYDVDAGTFLTISGEKTETIYPASVTKLFTAFVALQILEPDRVITVGDALDLVAAGSSVAHIQAGEQWTVERLVEAMLLPSGNDAACILAVEAGRVLEHNQSLDARTAADRFVAVMNARAAVLGMTGTHFANPDGIHKDNHYTTFADLAVLGELCLRNETILKYAGVSADTVTPEAGEEKQWHNTNATIDPESPYYCPYAIGLKTGQTPRAGGCLLSAFRCQGRTLVIGVFGCPDAQLRFADTLQLFNEAMAFDDAQ